MNVLWMEANIFNINSIHIKFCPVFHEYVNKNRNNSKWLWEYAREPCTKSTGTNHHGVKKTKQKKTIGKNILCIAVAVLSKDQLVSFKLHKQDGTRLISASCFVEFFSHFWPQCVSNLDPVPTLKRGCSRICLQITISSPDLWGTLQIQY